MKKAKNPSGKKNTQPRKFSRAASEKGSRAKRHTDRVPSTPRAPQVEDVAKPQAQSSTSSTSSTDVEDVEGCPKPPRYLWDMNEGLHRNCDQLGDLLASLPNLQLYRTAEGDGLIQVDREKVRRIATAKELAPLLIDNVVIAVIKNGKYHGDRVSEVTLGNMLHAKSFLRHFKTVKDVVTTPVVLSDQTTTNPGYNPQDGILYLGQDVSVASGMDAITRFLDVMEWQSNADRTNAV